MIRAPFVESRREGVDARTILRGGRLRKLFQFLASACQSAAVFQPAQQIKKMTAPLVGIWRTELQRNPHLGGRQLTDRKLETRRHDPDDRRGPAIQLNGTADNGSVASECSLPQTIRNDHRSGGARHVIFGAEQASSG